MASILESLTEQLTITEYGDWLVFVERLDQAVRSGCVRKVPVIKQVWARDEEWFLDPATGKIYVYAPPNPPSLPIWERVDVLRRDGMPDAPPLSIFKTGPITVMMAHVMKLRLEALVSRGLAEELPAPVAVPQSKDRTEKWYKDMVSNVVYRLSEYYSLHDADDLRWEVVPQALLNAKIQ